MIFMTRALRAIRCNRRNRRYWSACRSIRRRALNCGQRVGRGPCRVRRSRNRARRTRPSLVLRPRLVLRRNLLDLPAPEFFGEDYRVVAVDLGGHGGSTFGHREAWTIASFGSDVATVVKALGLQQVILIGHSMGGDVVADAARRLKGRVIGMIWLGTYSKLGTFRTPEEREKLIRAVPREFRGDDAEARARDVCAWRRQQARRSRGERHGLTPPNVALGSMGSSFSNDRLMPSILAELKLPVIAINPESAKTDRASLAQHGVEVVEMSGVGHFLMLEEPGRFNAILQDGDREAREALRRPRLTA